ncbi:MAG TPA: hypothetical protein PLX69_04380 [Leptospiraceae bacterium]|nr:hypothetical protein [Leptospiraceae bacterium]HRG73774.1 hypothetical protein [Leptospiraceae bacterium]
MKKSIIWNLSNGQEFPLDLWKHPKLAILINNVSLKDYASIELNPEEINIIFVSVDNSEWSSIEYNFLKLFGNKPEISLLLIAPSGNENLKVNQSMKGNYEILESPIRKKEVRLIIDRTIQAEFYKASAIEIGAGCLANIGFFEGLFELAHTEYKNSQDIIKAFEKMLEYEAKIKLSNQEVNQAMEKVNEMRDAEMLELVETLKANEKLDTLREKELREAIEIQEATEKALQFSRIEEMHMDKIIKAQNRIFEYTDKEIKELIQENIELKKKLGMKVEE